MAVTEKPGAFTAGGMQRDQSLIACIGTGTRGEAAGRGPAPQAMEQAPGPLGGEADLHPLKLPEANVQGQGALGIADRPGERGLEPRRPAALPCGSLWVSPMG